jgi:hypothetical protein
MSQINEFYEANEKSVKTFTKKKLKISYFFHFGVLDALISDIGVL